MTTDRIPLDLDAVEVRAETLFGIHQNPSKVIAELDLPYGKLQDWFGVEDGLRFGFKHMFKLFIYREVVGLNQEETADIIEERPFLETRFGFEIPRPDTKYITIERCWPSQPSISKWEKYEFSNATDCIEAIAERIREAGRESGAFTGRLAAPDPTPDEVAASHQPIHHYVDQHAVNIINAAYDYVWPELDTGRADNVKHEDEVVWEHQTQMSLMGNRSGSGATYRHFNKFRLDALHEDTHTYALKMLGSTEEHLDTIDDRASGEFPAPHWRDVAGIVQTQFHNAMKRLLDSPLAADLTNDYVVAAIDGTHFPFHSSPWKSEDDVNPDDPVIVVDEDGEVTKVPRKDFPEMVNGGEDKQTYEYQYATLTIVGHNAPIVLAIEPVRHDSTWEGDDGQSISWAETVDRLLKQATDLVDIDMVMADREFAHHGVAHVLDQYHNVNYLMPLKRDSKLGDERVDELLEDVKTEDQRSRVVKGASLHPRRDTPYIDVDNDPTIGEDRYSHDSDFLFVPADDEEWAIDEDNEYAVFVTNTDVSSPSEAITFADEYSKRWDIEIEYRMLKPVLPSIASTDYRVRCFTTAYSFLLYNLWRLVDHGLKIVVTEVFDDYGRDPDEERLDTLLPFDDFLATLTKTLFGLDGFDPPS